MITIHTLIPPTEPLPPQTQDDGNKTLPEPPQEKQPELTDNTEETTELPTEEKNTTKDS